MNLFSILYRKTLETLEIYWELIRLIVPVTLAVQVLSELGVIRAVAPFFGPVMKIFGLPPELAFAWLTGLLVGLWGAVATVFTLTTPSDLTVADMTVLSSLFLFAHALPIEQRIIQKAGPGFWITGMFRLIGGMIFAAILHQVFAATGMFAEPLDPSWIPAAEDHGWSGFAWSLAATLLSMLAILLALSWLMEILKLSGILQRMNRFLEPAFRLAGIEPAAIPCTAIGLFLGISYGGGMIIREARSVNLSPRQIFLACIFMGFAHSIIEDTLIVVALGADFNSVFFGRLVFAVLATALTAWLIKAIPEKLFFAAFFRKQGPGEALPAASEPERAA